MATANQRLVFERPIYELETRLAGLETAATKTTEATEEIRRLRRELADLKKKVYSNLDLTDDLAAKYEAV